MQPIYHTNPSKIESRRVVVDAYKKITNNQCIPEGKTYWCLCNYQPDVRGSEINELVSCGLITKSQFYGVDNSSNIISFNKTQHPSANWLCGDWLSVCQKNYSQYKSAALCFYDGVKTVINKQETRYIARGMDIAPKGITFVVNLMLSNPYSGETYNPNEFHKTIQSNLTNPNEWAYLPEYYSYISSHAKMATYFFTK